VITPRIFRRSLTAAAQARLLLLWWASLLVPGAIAALPVWSFLSAQLDHLPKARELVAFLDGATLIELFRQVAEPAAAPLGWGFVAAAIALVAVSPAMAGAMVAAARSDEALGVRELLRAAGELYGRMLRFALVSAAVLGVAGAGAVLVMKAVAKAGERAIWAQQAMRQERLGVLASVLLVFVFQLTLDAGRARLAVEPGRRSAFLAWWAGVRLLLRRPLRTFALGAVGTLAGSGLALVLMLLRLRIEQATPARLVLAFVLAQLATLAVGWGRAARIIGFAELFRVEAAERARAGGFAMAPPVTSPPPAAPAPPPGLVVARAEPPAAEVAPEESAALSPGTRSGT
jgi:hypothetical protein